jgi:16S rRNA (guanine527-N7)-methyltransferase
MPLLQSELLDKYVQAVLAAPSSLGLTATRDPAEFLERHVLDALKVLALLPPSMHQSKFKVIDIGSGNGIPGIPIAIAVPNWQVFLLDSNNRKSGFLDMFCNYNKIENAHVLTGRAESFAHQDEYRGQFDIAFARALGKLPVALELTVPYLKRNGLLVIPHGDSHKSEVANSQRALNELGAVLQDSIPYQLNPQVSFTALIFSKRSDTPERYPRKPGIPRKRPL